MAEFTLRFLGTGTSMGVPVVSCQCAVCTSPDPRDRRLRTSALLRHGEQQVIIDVGPDFRAQAIAAEIRQIEAVLLTHSHYDHIAGLDDLRPLTFSGRAMPIYGSPSTLADVRKRFHYAFEADNSKGSTRPGLDLRPFDAPFEVAGLAVEPLEVFHGTWAITAFRIGGLGYVTDASAIPPASRARLQGLDLLVLNALRITPHPTHFTLEEALAVVEELRPRRACFVHMTHDIHHAAIDASLPDGVNLAYDGLELTVRG